jgi:ribonuclease R
MKQARYAATCSGHFALGFDAYLHFTSPIRRYADLLVHRSLHRMLAGEQAPREGAEWAERAAIRTSARERAAVEAEREMTDLACCAVMRERVGDRFRGTITGVAVHGLYVTLDAPFVEGMVPVSRLSGYFDYEPERHRLVARGSRFQYRIGDRLRVEVASVNAERGWIDFDLVADTPRSSAPGGGEKRRPASGGAGRRGAGRGRRGRGPRPRG